MEYLFLLGRIIYAGILLLMVSAHFFQYKAMVGYASMKKLPMPNAAVIISGLVMTAGTIGVLLGAYVQIALWLIVLFLVPTAFLMHNFWTVTEPQAKMMEMIQFQKDLALAGAALMLLLIPTPWPLSIM